MLRGPLVPVSDVETSPSLLALFGGLRSYVTGDRNQLGLPEVG